MNKLLRFSCLLLPALAVLQGCQRPLVTDDDQPSGGSAKWHLVEFQSERLIQGIHVTPFEWQVISENQFSRLDSDNGLLEKRPLEAAYGVKGVPALSDNAFVRLTTDQDSRQTVEFHLARNPAQVVKISADSLAADGGEFVEVDVFARTIGAFSGDGSLFLLPAKVLPAHHYAFFLFEIQFNPAHNAFESVEVVKRIDLPELGAGIANLNSLRFLDGNFYLAAKEGAWRVAPGGQVSKVFNHWTLDFFAFQDTLYATGYNDFDLHQSNGSGLTWERPGHVSHLKHVEVAGDLVFTHVVLGNRYQLASEDFSTAKNIVFPAEAPSDPSVFYGVGFFAGCWYFSMDKEVWWTSEVVAK